MKKFHANQGKIKLYELLQPYSFVDSQLSSFLLWMFLWCSCNRSLQIWSCMCLTICCALLSSLWLKITSYLWVQSFKLFFHYCLYSPTDRENKTCLLVGRKNLFSTPLILFVIGHSSMMGISSSFIFWLESGNGGSLRDIRNQRFN